MTPRKPPKIFDPIVPTPELTYVYRFYGTDDYLLYVGLTNNLRKRFVQHQTNAAWWYCAERCTIELFANRAEAFWAEAMAIHLEEPEYNGTVTGPLHREELRARAEGRPLAPEFAIHFPDYHPLIQAHVRADGLEAELIETRKQLETLKDEWDAERRARIDSASQSEDLLSVIEGLREQLEAAKAGSVAVRERAERAERAEKNARRLWVISDGLAALDEVAKQPSKPRGSRTGARR